MPQEVMELILRLFPYVWTYEQYLILQGKKLDQVFWFKKNNDKFAFAQIFDNCGVV